ncbi:hypothetical protein VaNZ11_004283 [Volvox africanus]|uniref:Myb-like domain-containing protein n=1 Tax=Volvox africanus TaxID=51714 RepID=A0ABQ5RWI1_9CHLO|nr:hypothetical protein VaNZ11_004283 [Volvox africanus]
MEGEFVLPEELVREELKLKRVRDPVTNRVTPYHGLFDAGDAKELASAAAAGNTMLVHFVFGSSIQTDPGVPRVCRLSLPRLCLVSFAKREICRQAANGVYPSFLQLSWPETGEVLKDSHVATGDAGAPAQGVVEAGSQRTLASYGVDHNSVLKLDVVEGCLFEAIEYTDSITGSPEDATGRATATAAAANIAGNLVAAAEGGPAVHQASRRAHENPGLARIAHSTQEVQRRRRWTREEEFALLKGMQKHRGTLWKEILEDAEFKAILRGRTGGNLKDKWANLEKAAEQDFKKMKGDASEDKDLQRLVLEVMAALGKYISEW